MREYCPVDDAGRSLLRAAMQQLRMSARAYHRILKLARTIADLAGSETVQMVHLATAIRTRRGDPVPAEETELSTRKQILAQVYSI